MASAQALSLGRDAHGSLLGYDKKCLAQLLLDPVYGEESINAGLRKKESIQYQRSLMLPLWT